VGGVNEAGERGQRGRSHKESRGGTREGRRLRREGGEKKGRGQNRETYQKPSA